MENKELLYNEAIKMIENGDYLSAYNNLRRCKNYKDSKKLLENFMLICDRKISTTYDSDRNANRKFEEYEYDENNNLLLLTIYNPDNTIYGMKKCEYDKNGQHILCAEYGENGILECKYEYEYDENRNLIFTKFYSSSGRLKSKTEYQYDKNGNKILDVTYNSRGKIQKKEQINYDKNGNVTRAEDFNSDGNVTSIFEFEYDEYGNKIRFFYYSDFLAPCIVLQNIFTFEYDENGNITLEVDYNPDGTISGKREYQYDENGNRSQAHHYVRYAGASLSLFSKIEYKHDEYCNETLSVFYDQFGRYQYKTKCEYDAIGNVTLCAQYDEKYLTTKKFEIEYINPRVIYKPKNK